MTNYTTRLRTFRNSQEKLPKVGQKYTSTVWFSRCIDSVTSTYVIILLTFLPHPSSPSTPISFLLPNNFLLLLLLLTPPTFLLSFPPPILWPPPPPLRHSGKNWIVCQVSGGAWLLMAWSTQIEYCSHALPHSAQTRRWIDRLAWFGLAWPGGLEVWG